MIKYIGEGNCSGNHAGNKARSDINTIMEKHYGKALLNFNHYKFESKFQKIKFMLSRDMLCTLGSAITLSNNIAVLQYPFYYDFMTKWCLKRFVKNNLVAFVVHDVDILRDAGKSTLEETLDELNAAKILIVHNSHMKNKLKEIGVTTPMIELELFDYVLNTIPQSNYKKNHNIIFAGNLEKSKFLLSERIQRLGIGFNLYGPNYEKSKIHWDNIFYKGSYTPDEIPYKLRGSFGLVWDGTSTDTCDGAMGQYMQYNNPHKLSLYIAAGVPVIVWRKAAIADFVKKSGIGFVIDSLGEIAEKRDKITPHEYNMFINNTKVLQRQICQGEFTHRALALVEDFFKLS